MAGSPHPAQARSRRSKTSRSQRAATTLIFRSERAPHPLHHREGPQELRRHQPHNRASGKVRTVQARYVRNNRLADALQRQAFRALQSSPGARRYYDKQPARYLDYNPALRQLGNRLIGILHGCLKTRTYYDERRGNRMVTPRNLSAAA
ncbi:hypothetical protein ACWCQZ_47575 [Streptomyces sp. NPDC002285]